MNDNQPELTAADRINSRVMDFVNSFTHLHHATFKMLADAVADEERVRLESEMSSLQERIKQLEAEVTRLKIENDLMNQPHP